MTIILKIECQAWWHTHTMVVVPGTQETGGGTWSKANLGKINAN
jgi:hypothetical protein